MKKNIKWRLGKLPTPDELRALVKDKIITQEEARQILVETKEEGDVDVDSLKAEIEFLKNVIDKLNSPNTIQVIREYTPRIKHWGWCDPYINYCSTINNIHGTAGTDTTISLGTLNTQ